MTTKITQLRKKKLDEESDSRLMEVGKLAVWTLSTAKHGNGVAQLRDNNFETFWQSDGQQPHLITIQFHKLTHVRRLDLYLDYKLDESYTPQVMQVRSGLSTAMHQMIKVKDIEVEEPSGWINTNLDVKTLCLQIAILSNHQNGRDTHVRQVNVWGHRRDEDEKSTQFSSTFQQFSTIR